MARFRRFGLLVAEMVLLVAIAALFTLRAPPVQGASMEPRVHAGELVVIATLAYRFRPVRRGDLVAFHRDAPTPATYLKRVVGLAGERVAIERGTVIINGRPLPEPYVAFRDARSVAPLTVPPGALYVLGDNRPASDDSRDWGPVPLGDVVGEAIASAWPPRRLR